MLKNLSWRLFGLMYIKEQWKIICPMSMSNILWQPLVYKTRVFGDDLELVEPYMDGGSKDLAAFIIANFQVEKNTQLHR